MFAIIRKIIDSPAALLELVPSGGLTRMMGGLVALVGLGGMATQIIVALHGGGLPSAGDLKEPFGLFLLGGGVVGGARKAEKMREALDAIVRKPA